MYQIAKEFHFSASHIIEGLPQGHKCGRLHGHNYRVILYLKDSTLDEVGFVTDFGDLKPFKEFITDSYDHRHLNDIYPFGPRVPTTSEGIARHLFEVATKLFGDGQVSKVRVWETDKAWGEYWKEPSL